MSQFKVFTHKCLDEPPALLMVRPNYHENDPTKGFDSVEVICSVRPDNCDEDDEIVVELEEPCYVQRGDMMGISTQSSKQEISYDKVKDYPCVFLDPMYSVIEDETCDRKYSMQFTYNKFFFASTFYLFFTLLQHLHTPSRALRKLAFGSAILIVRKWR